MKKKNKQKIEPFEIHDEPQRAIEQKLNDTQLSYVSYIPKNFLKRLILTKQKGIVIKADYTDCALSQKYIFNINNIEKVGTLEEFFDDLEFEIRCQIEDWIENEHRMTSYIIQFKNKGLYFIDFEVMHEECPDMWDSYNPR